MTPLKKESYSDYVGKKSRIGPNERNPNLKDLDFLTKMMDSNSPISIDYDLVSSDQPYFKTYSYFDALNSLFLQTCSPEINVRITKKVLSDSNTSYSNYSLDDIMDKYVSEKIARKKYKKVVFLPGDNMINMVDMGSFRKLMQEDLDWFVKPHPISTDELLEMLASLFGWHRVIDPGESAKDIVKNLTHSAGTSSSELMLVSNLLGIETILLDNFSESWKGAFYPYTRWLDTGVDNRITLNKLLTHPLTAPYTPEVPHGDNVDRMKSYFKTTMEMREYFKPLTGMVLQTIPDFNPVKVRKD